MLPAIQSVIVNIRREMTARGLRLAVAESLTGGGVQRLISSISGASDFFEGGITAYSIHQKVTHLGVDQVMAEACNGVSLEVALQMARGVCNLFGCDVGVATTGYAEPDRDRNVAQPFAFVAVYHREQAACPIGERVTSPAATADRNAMQNYVSESAVRLLHDCVSRLP